MGIHEKEEEDNLLRSDGTKASKKSEIDGSIVRIEEDGILEDELVGGGFIPESDDEEIEDTAKKTNSDGEDENNLQEDTEASSTYLTSPVIDLEDNSQSKNGNVIMN